jgi:hypothetical protein
MKRGAVQGDRTRPWLIGHTALTAVAVSATLLLGTAACSSGSKLNGEEKKTSTQVVTDATAALKAAKSVHLSGTQTDTSGETKTVTTIDLHYLNGTGSYGTVTTGGATLQLIRIGKDLYVKGPNLFGATAARTIGDHYVKLSASSGTGQSLGAVTDLSQTADQLLNPGGKVGKTVDRATVSGNKAVVLTETADNGTGKLYVANTGSPVPLRIVATGSSASTLNLTDFGAPVTIKAPAGAVTLPGT